LLILIRNAQYLNSKGNGKCLWDKDIAQTPISDFYYFPMGKGREGKGVLT